MSSFFHKTLSLLSPSSHKTVPADSADEEDSRSSAFSDEEPEVVKVEPLSTKKSKGRPRKEKAQTPPPAKEEEEEDNEEEEEEDDDDEEEDV